MTRKWQGTALFAVIMAGVSVTVAGRVLAGGGPAAEGSTTSGTATEGSVVGSAGTAGATGTTVKGDAVQTAYGPVQVELSYSGSKITKVSVLEAPDGGGRDQMLTNYAVPQLNQEVIASQSAHIDTISGATYTSQGYISSVQSAIDKHG